IVGRVCKADVGCIENVSQGIEDLDGLSRKDGPRLRRIGSDGPNHAGSEMVGRQSVPIGVGRESAGAERDSEARVVVRDCEALPIVRRVRDVEITSTGIGNIEIPFRPDADVRLVQVTDAETESQSRLSYWILDRRDHESGVRQRLEPEMPGLAAII